MRMKSRGWILAAAVVASALVLSPYAAAVRADALAPERTSVTFTDRSGTPLGTILSPESGDAAPVPLEDVSPSFVNAILAAEDARFFSHGAVDVRSAARAAWQTARCLCNAGGASTIDMQVARMHFGLGTGIRGKLEQVWDAARIDAGSGKRAILNAYVNRIPMGGNLYGVEAAARTYFGVPASDLDLAQAALLAGIPNDPVRLDPRDHWAAARARQRAVLDRMRASGSISETQLRIAARETLHLRVRDDGLWGAQQLLFDLARQERGGGRVRTTIDAQLQRFVQAQAADVVQALSAHTVTQASVLVIDNRTGEVLAYLGSLDYFDDAYLGRNDGVRSLRQPGSTLKPFLYEYALERGALAPGTILADVPSSYAIPNGEIYSPEDYDRRFSGPVSVRTALANSLNVPAVRVLSGVGVPAFLDRLHALGFAHLQRAPSYYGLGLTLGAGEVTLWDLAQAYVTLARSGSAIPLRALAGSRTAPQQIGNPDDWRFVTDILADRYARARAFGIGSVLDMPFQAAVKTGTSSGYRDTWTVGYTPEYTVAVWVGNFSGAPMQRIAGVSGAGPLWNRIMLHLYERRDPARFTPPPQSMLARVPTGPLPHASAAYDEWRLQQEQTTGPLRILFPHDGDLFEDTLTPSDPHRAEQQLALRISRPRSANVRWTINGAHLATGSTDAFNWTVRPGAFTLTVSADGVSSSVRFNVVARRRGVKRGFSVIGADSKTN